LKILHVDAAKEDQQKFDRKNVSAASSDTMAHFAD